MLPGSRELLAGFFSCREPLAGQVTGKLGKWQQQGPVHLSCEFSFNLASPGFSIGPAPADATGQLSAVSPQAVEQLFLC